MVDYEIKVQPTYWARIWVGTRVAYTDEILDISMARKLLHDYVDTVSSCVTLTETEFIYKSKARTGEKIDGEEPGFVIGIIQYPLYPASIETLRKHAEHLAVCLKDAYKQLKVTVVFPDITLTLYS